MRPSRQVRRAGVRPNYTRRGVKSGPSFRIPTINVGWLRIAAVSTTILLALVIISRSTSVQQVKIEGDRTLAYDRVTGLAQEGLREQWFGRNLLLVNTGMLEGYLKEHEPAIKEAAISRQFLHTVSISITERQPTINWKTGDGVYLLDADATVIGPTKGSYTRLPTVTDSNNLPVKTGERVAPVSFINFCKDIVAGLPAAGFQVGEITVPATTSEVYIRTDKRLVLKFDTTRPAGEALDDLKAVKVELNRAKKTPAEYIDLRIPNKAYYK